MKKALLLLGLTTIIIIGILILRKFNDNYAGCISNVRNVKMISVGISCDSMIAIMGKPDTLFVNPLDKDQTIYLYVAPPFSDDNVKIHCDSSGCVARISGYGKD